MSQPDGGQLFSFCKDQLMSHMMKRAALCMLILAIAVAAQAQSQSIKRLDLTIANSPLPEETTTMQGTGFGTSKPQSLALLMTLTKVDGAYRGLDPLQFEVLLENVGDRPVRLPWSRRTISTADWPETNVVSGSLFLRFVDEKGTQFQGPGVVLTGLITGDTSMLLQPREKASIVVPATWSSLSPKTLRWWKERRRLLFA